MDVSLHEDSRNANRGEGTVLRLASNSMRKPAVAHAFPLVRCAPQDAQPGQALRNATTSVVEPEEGQCQRLQRREGNDSNLCGKPMLHAE